ncbi:MAG TPA: hypothetical protein VGZ22_25425 [Isosphaeraceae bacterium]|jgi:hypothetical protein|nr:hypothetical protein [Isosphaeraceae bacterium]
MMNLLFAGRPIQTVCGLMAVFLVINSGAVQAGGHHRRQGTVAVSPAYVVYGTPAYAVTGGTVAGTTAVTNPAGVSTAPGFVPMLPTYSVAPRYSAPAYYYTYSVAPAAVAPATYYTTAPATAPVATNSYLTGNAPVATNAFIGASGQANPSAPAPAPPAASNPLGGRILLALKNLATSLLGDRGSIFPSLLQSAIDLFVSETGFRPNDTDHRALQDLVNRALDERGPSAVGGGAGQGGTQLILQGPFNITIPNATIQVTPANSSGTGGGTATGSGGPSGGSTGGPGGPTGTGVNPSGTSGPPSGPTSPPPPTPTPNP